MDDRPFQPNWAVPPGETIQEWFDQGLLTESHFLAQTGLSELELEHLRTGKLEITQELAEKLCWVLGPSKQFWLNLEANYREDLKRLKSNAQTPTDL